MKMRVIFCFLLFAFSAMVVSCDHSTINESDGKSDFTSTETVQVSSIIVSDSSTQQEEVIEVPSSLDSGSEITASHEENYLTPEGVTKPMLTVLGVKLAQGNLVKFQKDPKCTLVPFVAVVKALGADVEWKSNVEAEVSFKNQKFNLNILQPSFKRMGMDFNCIIVAPGGKKIVFETLEKELLLDTIALKTAVLGMGVSLKIDADANEENVEISLVK